ncbi:protein NUCLEAR FUSION DEFECTIVE 2 [Phragmites australis]|uniref:protein NUCLEAR FUSION DEFECTIVE 2 n=1 Tax=Phragmites australis TaxID=29695 RepID=UPI002D7877CA|nr:protein NUCLEAR FUSION DEFECTIVE 2 [Phragmites australis]
MAIPQPLLLLCLLVSIAFPSHPRAVGSGLAPASSSPFDAALATLQTQIGHSFRAPDLLRRAMTHASYSRENGRALAVLGLAAAQSAAAIRSLSADHDATASAVARRAREAASEAACAAAGTSVGIPAIVRVAGGVNASADPVICGAFRALIGAVAVDANSTDTAGEVFWRLHVLTAASATAAM